MKARLAVLTALALTGCGGSGGSGDGPEGWRAEKPYLRWVKQPSGK